MAEEQEGEAKLTSKGSFHYDPDKNYDEATMAQLRDLEKGVAESQDLVSGPTTFDQIEEEYAKEDEIYRHKVEELKKKYQYARRTRGDGNCFYRAFGYAYLESLLLDRTDLSRFKEAAQKSKDELVSLGFPQFTIEDFHETFMDVVGKVENKCTQQELFELFNDQGMSDYLVVYLRLLVSGYLQKESEFFASFIEGERTVKEFCHQEVEPMGKESDHIHIIALTSSLGVPVRIEYVDRTGRDTVNHHDFPEGSKPAITLLYRPGHYDIVYP